MDKQLSIKIRLIDQITAGLRGISQELGLTGANATKVGSSVGGMAKSFVLSAAAGVGLYQSIHQLAATTVNFIKTSYTLSSALEQSSIAFTTMLGSAEAADKMLRDMKEFAAKTPFEFMELQGAAKRMFAYGFSAEEVLPKLTAVGDAAAALGGGGEMIGRITLALGQMQAKGKVSGEELRQLSEAGIPALKYLADAAKMTTAEFTDFQKKGIVPADQAIRALIQGMETDFGGMMAAQTETAAGQMSMLKDEVSYLQIALGDTFRDEVLSTTKFIITMTKSLREWVEAIGEKRTLVKGVGKVDTAIGFDFSELKEAYEAEMRRRASKNGMGDTRSMWQKFLGNSDENRLNSAIAWDTGTMSTASALYGKEEATMEMYATVLVQTEQGEKALRLLIESYADDMAAFEENSTQERLDRLEERGKAEHQKEVFFLDLSQKTRKQRMKEDEDYRKEVEARAGVVQGFYSGVTKQQEDADKDNQKNIKDTTKALQDAIKQYGGMQAAKAKNADDIKTTRALLLGEIDALTGLENKTGVYARSLGELDTTHRDILGQIHAYQEKQKAGIPLTQTETEDLLKLGQARNDLMPALNRMVGWTESMTDRNTRLHDSNASIQADIDELKKAIEESGETTDNDRKKLQKWEEQMGLNNTAMTVNTVAQNTAKATTDLLTGSYDENYKKLQDMVKESGGYAGATDTAKTKIDELKVKLAELLEEEKRLTEGVTLELRKRIIEEEIALAAKDGLDKIEVGRLLEKMKTFGLQHEETLRRKIIEMHSAEGLQILQEQITTRFGDDYKTRTAAEAEYTRLSGIAIQTGILPNIQDMINLSITAAEKIAGVYTGLMNLPPLTTVRIHTIFSSEGKDAADSAPGGASGQAAVNASLLGSTTIGSGVSDEARAAAARKVISDAANKKITDKQAQDRLDAAAAATINRNAALQAMWDLHLGKKATGGSVMGDRSYLVGEHGAELFTPAGGRTGTITSNLATGRMVEPQQNTQTINIANITVTGVQDVQSLYKALQKEAKARGKSLAN